MKQNINHYQRYLRFFKTGILNTIIGYSVFVVLFTILNHKELAVTLGMFIGIAFSYKTYHKLVFKDATQLKFKNYVIIHFSVYFLNLCHLWIFVDYVGLNVYLAQFIALVYIPLIKYYLNMRYVFKIKPLNEVS